AWMGEDQLEAGPHRVDTLGQTGMPAGQSLLDQNALGVTGSVVQNRFFALLAQVVSDHGAIPLLQCQQPALDGLAGNAVGENLAFALELGQRLVDAGIPQDRKSTRLNSSHVKISYAVFCLKKKKDKKNTNRPNVR